MRAAEACAFALLLMVVALARAGVRAVVAQPAPSIDVAISGPRQGAAGEPLTLTAASGRGRT